MVITMNETLQFLRESYDYTQEDIAKLLDVSQVSYSRWERKELLIPLYQLNKLANILNSSMDYIMELTRNNKPTNKIENIDFNIVAKRITEIREDNDLSMRALAKILNTSHSTISSYESGKNLIIISFALELSKKYKISLDWLVGRSNNKYIK